MEEVTRKKAFAIDLRARFPLLVRAVALLVLIAGLSVVVISYYRLRNNVPFRLRSEAPELSKEVTGIIEGYEQRVTKDDRLYLWLRAARDITYSDGHHELEDVKLAVYPAVGDVPDQISANRAIYDPKSSVISFIGNVQIETKDALKVETESIAFDRDTEVATTDESVLFSRENVSGRAVGAVVEAKHKKIHLKSGVQITVDPRDLKTAAASSSTRARPLVISSSNALFEQEALKLSFFGGVTAEQERDIMSGDQLYATLNAQKRLQKVELRGNSYLRSMETGKSAEVHSIDMDFFLDRDQRLERALAARDARARTLDADSEVQLNGASLIEVMFQAQEDRSLLKEMRTEGRTTITLAAPKSKASDPKAANKRLIADAVKLFWRSTGRDLERAEAVGNGELFVDPITQTAGNDRKILTASRFDCEFYEAGNLARNFTATGGSKAVIEPSLPGSERAKRTLTSQKMIASFTKDTQDIDRVDAQGEAKFTENDRHGTAANMSYTTSDETVRLRGGEPTVWDSRARTKAIELDSDLRYEVSYSRGKTATTYYSQEQTNGATPFTRVKSPVFIVSDRGQFHHKTGIAIYTDNARAWQDDNYVRAEKLTIYVSEKKMEANGRVQSALYDAKRRIEGKASSVPVFVTADSMVYSEPNRTLRYEGNVDIRQANDRLTSDVADVFLRRESNEVEKTVAQRNVVLTQPNRKAVGDWVQYTTDDEVAILTGSPARVEDVEQGSTEGGRLTVNLRESRVTADDQRGSQSPGRVRSTHKVRRQPSD